MIYFIEDRKCLIEINPNQINYELQFKKDWAADYSLLKNFNERFISGNRYLGLVAPEISLGIKNSLEDSPHIKAMYKRFVLGKDWDETEYFDMYHSWYLTADNGRYASNSYEHFKVTRLLAWDRIYNEIKSEGYKRPFNIQDNIEVAVRGSSEIYLIDGRHRLYMSKILNLPAVPVCVNILTESAIPFIDSINLDPYHNCFPYISMGHIDSIQVLGDQINFIGWAIDESCLPPQKLYLAIGEDDYLIETLNVIRRPDVMAHFNLKRDDYGFSFKTPNCTDDIKNKIVAGNYAVKMASGKSLSKSK